MRKIKNYLNRWMEGVILVIGFSIIFLLPPDERMTFVKVLGTFILIVFSVAILIFYFETFIRRKDHLFSFLLLSMALIGKLFILLPSVPNYLIPIAFFSIFTSFLFSNAPLAVTGSLLLSILLSISAGNLEILPVLLIGGLVGAYSTSSIHQRTDLTRAGIYVGIANVCIISGISFINEYPFLLTLPLILWGMSSGILSSIIVMIILPYVETYSGITTNIRLLELINPQFPLLRRLFIEAPGTYHHSMMVANLAQGAADSIGANSLLVKVGSYYHDIGKIIRPHFFFENYGKNSGENDYHKKVNPNLSSTIIVSHVKDGVDLAQKYRLPLSVIEIIRQHHGTSLIAYFYRKALLSKKKEKSVDEGSFRYLGPKPQSKEAAIVMLADSIEAAFRFSPQITLKGAKDLVRKVIDNKLKDGQLEECNLTLREITRITQAFESNFTGIIHTRGRYPAEVLKE